MSRKQHAHTIRLPKSAKAKFVTGLLVILVLAWVISDPGGASTQVNDLKANVSVFFSEFGGGQ